MSKGIIPGIIAVACLGAAVTGVTFANHTVAHTALKNMQNQRKAAPEITLYKSANSKDVLKQIPVEHHQLIPIFRQGDWLKVGDPKNGDVAWVNLPQYDAAVNEVTHPHQESLFFSEIMGKDGKMHITAYKNGKQLSEKEAKKLYDHARHQEKEELHRLNIQYKHMQEQEARMFNTPFFHQGFGGATYFAPPQVIVVQPHHFEGHGPVQK